MEKKGLPTLQYSNTPVNSNVPVTIRFRHMAPSIEKALNLTYLSHLIMEASSWKI